MITLDIALLGAIERPLWLISPDDGSVLWANPAALRAWEVAALEDAPVAALVAAVPEEFVAEARGAAGAAAPQGLQNRWPVRAEDGEIAHLPAEAWAVTVDDRPALLVMLPQAPRAAADAELLALVQRSPVPASVFSADGRLLRCNPAAEALYGALAPALVARFEDPADHARLVEELDGAGRAVVIARMRRVGGTARWQRVDAVKARDADSGAEVIDVVEADVDELCQAREAEAARAEEAVISRDARTDFLSTMSHEIRNHLTGVVGLSGLLVSRLPSGPERELAEQLVRSGRTLEHIASQMLDLSRIEAGGLALEAVEFRPFNLVDAAQETHAHTAAARGLDFVAEAGEGANIARIGDEHRISQIIDNLVGNAIRFTEAGAVTVRIWGLADQPLSIEVADTGIGIAPEQQAAIFEPYAQAGADIARRFGGSGLGLHIVRDLVASMNGVLQLDSAPGAGSTFTVRLPLPLAVAKPGEPLREAPRLPPGLRVLTVEPARLDRGVLELFLSTQRANVTAVASVHSALAKLAAERFDLVILDDDVAGAESANVLASLRFAEADGRAASVILVGTRGPGEARRRAARPGFDGYVGKPLRLEELTTCILRVTEDAADRRALGGPRLVDRGSR
ncbi:hypothetical protein LNKW23_18910 [Paralimibaculum aggregatum]|uniref:histidine kinase n=1 Tax=Paralimibaculum aggregatum TaxID=3036245 RepID=A0ABQ6LN94_9RHOB|nr:ATP-binding protein [Limibaculum sp. NKW23]GMG82678.1 hypothetical protein LNKW23_18910 [Limibaculum sp. NKW23]